MASLAFHCLPALLKEGWASPQGYRCRQWVLLREFGGGQWSDDMPTVRRNRKSPGAHLYSASDGRDESVIYPKLFPTSLLPTSEAFRVCPGTGPFWVRATKRFEPRECGKKTSL